MPIYKLSQTQVIHSTLEEVWDFISNPKNLKEITPDYMGFDIISQNLEERIYPGMIIIYKVKPLLGIKLTWVTEITHVDELRYFVDEQRFGPYAFWHHEHFIELHDEGVLMRDAVSYKPPFGWIGHIANRLFLRKQLEKIFAYRRIILERRFAENKQHSRKEP